MLHRRIWSPGAVFISWFCWCSLLNGAGGQITHPTEVAALRAIRRSFIDPNKNLSSWNHGDPCKQNWTGVDCFNTTLTDGYLHIKELLLLNMNLSGRLSPEFGRLSHLKILDVTWNKISGSIPKEIGNMTSLELLLLNGNHLTGALPEEIGNLHNLDRIQIDENQISGTLPKSLANLKKIKHLHMNNNSISGQIPPELSLLPDLVHLLLDNNNLSGYLPPELAKLSRLLILQLDNNHFEGATIPATYSNMSHLLKLSLRNCSLQGPLPELNRIPDLAYIDLSSNQLSGPIPQFKLSVNITTIDVSNNKLSGPIPGFPGQPRLQKLALANNLLRGTVSSIIWQNRISNGSERLIIDFRNNMLTNISGSLSLPPNVTVRLEGNPICSNTNLVQFCGSEIVYVSNIEISTKADVDCPVAACPPPFQYAPASPEPCFCAAPLFVGFRLKSPGFSDFMPYTNEFQVYLTTGLKLKVFQLDIGPVVWDEGPRLRMYLKLFPVYLDNSSSIFNKSEVARIRWMFTAWKIRDSKVFGPHELLNFTLWGPYEDVNPSFPRSGITKAALAGIVAGTIAGAVSLSAVVLLLILRIHTRKQRKSSHKRLSTKISMKIDGLRSFDYRELTRATNNFDPSTQIGQGGYGKVYKGVLDDGMIVAVKRAEEGSLQGRREFFTEIELLSRLHHRNLITLTGYCDEAGEQVLVYEYVPNGTLRDHLTGKSKGPLSFAMRLRIALGSAKGILYLHTEADPPIFHRDIKATNILLDSHFTVKVADFGLSRLAPVPDFEGTIPAHISTVVRGTPGYLDPEYFRTHQLTDKSDVYSLGVVFLELLTGMHPISLGKNIVREVNNAYKSGVIFSLIDERMGSYPSECVEKFVSLALRCCLDEPEARPAMAEVVRELEIIWKMMPDSDTRTIDSSNGGTDTSPPSSSSSMNNHHPYVSADVSGSDLVSGVVPLIKPR